MVHGACGGRWSCEMREKVQNDVEVAAQDFPQYSTLRQRSHAKTAFAKQPFAAQRRSTAAAAFLDLDSPVNGAGAAAAVRAEAALIPQSPLWAFCQCSA